MNGPATDPGDIDLPGGDTIPKAFSLPFEALDDELPVLLLPVRIETRFLPTRDPTELVIRIFPDDVHTDQHVAQLDRVEVELGQSFWRSAWPSTVRRRQLDGRFERLAARLGVHRAAWVLEATRPLNWLPGGKRSGEPAFPAPNLRKTVTPGRARLLPTQWVVTGYVRDDRKFVVAGAEITADLPVTPDLAATDTPPASIRDLMDAQGMTWLHDLEAAEQAGMAVRVPLGSWDVEAGIDLFVVGVRAGTTTGAADLAALLAAHHWTTGLDFLRRGTPTNNSDEAPAGYSATQPDLATLLTTVLTGTPATSEIVKEGPTGPRDDQIELPPMDRVPRLADQTFASALGLALGPEAPSLLDRLPHAADDQLRLGSSMNAALWPATWGHFFRHMVAPSLPGPDIAWLRDRFIGAVPGGGPLPSLRLGRQPYGILPVAVDRLEDAAEGREHALATVLLDQVPHWDNAVVEWVPRLDPDAADIAGGAGGRRVSITEATTTLARILGATPNPSDLCLRGVTDDTQRYWEAWEGAMTVLILTIANSSDDVIELFNQLLVAATLEEQIELCREIVLELPDGDPFEEFFSSYLLDGHTTSVDGEDTYVPALLAGQETRTSMLLTQPPGVDRTAVTARIRESGEPRSFFATFDTTTIPWTGPLVHAGSEPGQDGAPAVAAWLADMAEAAEAGTDPAAAPPEPPPLLYQLLARAISIVDPADRPSAVEGLRALADAAADPGRADPAAELETLLGETLGTCMNRLDAWLSGTAITRLESMRWTRPRGLEVGGFGWVLGLAPTDADRPSQGHIHAASLDLAATAAILRSGWNALGGGTPGGQGLAVDLSSARSRAAAWIVDGVRDGRRLSELLGQALERELHDAGLAAHVAPVRRRVLDARGQPGRPANAIVDGYLVARGWQGADQVSPLTDEERAVRRALLDYLDGDGAADRTALSRIFDRHAAGLDAVADTGLAQAVHALVRGNPTAASAAIDGITAGEVGPADLSVLRTARGGQRVTHRVLALFDNLQADAPDPDSPAGRSLAPDAIAEPALEAWVAERLQLSSVGYGVWLEIDGGRVWRGPFSVAASGLGALELLYDLTDGPDAGAGRLARRLAARCARAVAAQAGRAVEVTVDPDLAGPAGGPDPLPAGLLPPDPLPPDAVPLRLWLPAAQALRSVLRGARAAGARDLALDDPASSVDLSLLAAREAGLRTAIDRTAAGLRAGLGPDGSTAALVDALAAAERWRVGDQASVAGLRDLVTPGGDAADRAALVADAEDALAALAARVAARDRLVAEAGTPDAATTLAAIAALLPGAVVLPLFAAPDAAGLAASADRSGRRSGGRGPAMGWLHQVGRTREQVGWAADALDLLEVAAGDCAVQPTVVQLPDLPEEGWAATSRPERGNRTCLFAVAWPRKTLAGLVSGFVVDAWTEVIPDRRVTTGLAVHADAPSARAPQAMLLAVPPPGGSWSFEEVLACVRQTLARAKQRAVGPELVEHWAQYLPAVYLADDTDPGPPAAAGTSQVVAG